jgi:hypothetical protein
MKLSIFSKRSTRKKTTAKEATQRSMTVTSRRRM